MNYKILFVFSFILIIVLSNSACRENAKVETNIKITTNQNTVQTAATPVKNPISAPVNTNAANSVSHHDQDHASDMDGTDEGMLESSPDAASQPYDLQFIDTMIQHHQAAIVMAKMVLAKSQNHDLKKFAGKVISVQEAEIEKMENWRDQWYQFKLDAINMDLPGMTDSMKRMVGTDMDNLETAEGKEFENHFLEMMIPHHQGAVLMAKDALQKAEHPEIKKIAAEIISSQEQEVTQMSGWKNTAN